ncbi:MAG: SDR family NAD(P)-dependent oxidoreductase [Blastocatellia bacterium]|nr:SDR family NAD(P)-dependent oxidoreductase [Blastocatellia bacterium]
MRQGNWTAELIPKQMGKVVIVTGSSSGIGYETARVLANQGAEVIIAVRNQEKGKRALQQILGQNPAADVKVMELDLANLASVEQFAVTFRKTFTRLDILINNAGVMIPPYEKTLNGFELQFGTNHLGHFALTGHLLEVLTSTKGARIVNVSSSAHRWGKINFGDLTWEKRKYSPWKAYSDSKIANLYFTSELTRKLKENKLDLLTTAAHPGWTATDLQRHTGVVEFLNRFLAMDIAQGALPTLRAAIDTGVTGGEFFGPNGLFELWGFPIEVQPNQLSQDETIARQLWSISEELTGVKFVFSQRMRA